MIAKNKTHDQKNKVSERFIINDRTPDINNTKELKIIRKLTAFIRFASLYFAFSFLDARLYPDISQLNFRKYINKPKVNKNNPDKIFIDHIEFIFNNLMEVYM